jgi:hypothetical protein
MGAVKNAFLYGTPPCRECKGEGETEHPHLSNYAGSHAESPADPVMVDCDHCDGTGECDCVDCSSDAAEAAHERMLDGEPPLSADERHQIAWKQKQELRR